MRSARLVAMALLAFTACDGQAQRTAPADATRVRVETVAEGLNHPWGLAFLPDGSMLVTERNGAVLHLGADGAKSPVVNGPENVFQRGQSGLQDIVLDPRFAENGLVYVSFAETSAPTSRLALFRARYADGAFRDSRVIFRATLREHTNHPGGRMLFLPDETLLLVVGVADNQRANAQRLDNYLGKILRLDREGGAPADNPFVGAAGALPEIYTLGHRNIMGLARDAETGAVWAHENGPRGGDELNLIRPGANYGWPEITYGREYSGAVITEETSRAGMEDPATQWTPSIAPSGMAVYHGEAFPHWDGDLLIGFLADRQVRLVDVSNPDAPQQTELDLGLNERIRDVRLGPDGFVYLLTDDDNGRLLRLRPAN